jgi:hypothetical protein
VRTRPLRNRLLLELSAMNMRPVGLWWCRAPMLTSVLSVSLAVDGAGLGAMLCRGTMTAGDQLL